MLPKEYIRAKVDHKIIEELFKGTSSQTIFYKKSYPRIIERFEESRHKKHLTQEDWIERISLIYSWMPAIPKRSFMISAYDNTNNDSHLNEILEQLSVFDNIFNSVKLNNVEIELEKSIVRVINSNEEIDLRELFSLIGQVMNNNSNYRNQVSSISKLLHFTCPDLFPILDRNVAKKLFGGMPTLRRYSYYMQSVKELVDEEQWVSDLAENYNVSVLYIIDLVLFNYDN